MRTPFSAASRGSQKWLQVLINDYPAILAKAMTDSSPDAAEQPIKWVSPLRADAYAEYRDTAFLQQLGLERFTEALRNFWPTRGPQWDGLGRDAHQRVYLVEAKAHVSELASDCKAKSPSSLHKIERAFQHTQLWLNSTPQRDWKFGYYQQANRLAHLYFMREIIGLEAHLINLYVVNDPTYIATSMNEWGGALTLQKRLLGLSGRPYDDVTIDLFVDVGQLAEM